MIINTDISKVNLLHGVEKDKIDFFLKKKQFLDTYPVLSDTRGMFWLLDGHHRFVAYCLYQAGYANVRGFLQNTGLDFFPNDIFSHSITVSVNVEEDIKLQQVLAKEIFNPEKFLCCFSKYCVFPDTIENYDPDFIYFYKDNSFLKIDKEKITKVLKSYIDFNKFFIKNTRGLDIDYSALINYLQQNGYTLVVEWYAYTNFTNPDERTEYDFKTMKAEDLNSLSSPYPFTKEELIRKLKQKNFSKIRKDIENKKIYLEQ